MTQTTKGQAMAETNERITQDALGIDELTTEFGRTGLKHNHGVIDEEFLRQLRGPRAAQVYGEMWANDSIVQATWFAIDMLIRRVRWDVAPQGDSPVDQDAAAFVESCMADMSHTWLDLISEVLSELIFGFSVHEIVYKWRRGDSPDSGQASRYNDGRIGWRKMPIRAQDTVQEWLMDANGGIQGIVQTAPPDYVPRRIPIEKLLLFRTTAHKGNPEGRSALRAAYRPWSFKRRVEEIEGIGIERDLAGLPVMSVPERILASDAAASDRALLGQLKRLVTNIRRDSQEGVIIPSSFDANGHPLYTLQLLSTGGSRQFDTNAVINRYERSIAMTVLADFILLGHEQTGTYSLGVSKADIFTQAIQSWADGIADVFNRHAITRLLAVNGILLEQPPLIKPGQVAQVDLAALGDYIVKLSQSGAQLWPDVDLENYLRRVGHLPEKPEDAQDEAALGTAVARLASDAVAYADQRATARQDAAIDGPTRA